MPTAPTSPARRAPPTASSRLTWGRPSGSASRNQCFRHSGQRAVGSDRCRQCPPPGEHRSAHGVRLDPVRLDPHRCQRHLDRHRADHLHLPVAALRHGRRQLLGHRWRDRRHLRPRTGGRGRDRPGTRHRHQRRRELVSAECADRSDRRGCPVEHGASDDQRDRPGGLNPDGSKRTWTGTAPITFTYQWLRCDTSGANCSDIASGTNSTYDLVPADIGQTIRVRVTGTGPGGSSSAQSSQTSAVTARNPVNTALPTISGTAQEGSTLTAAERHLDRHGADQLQLPVAALRHERRQLLGYRRRNEQQLRPGPGGRRLDDPRPRHRLECRRQFIRPVEPDDRRHSPQPGQHRAADDLRYRSGGPDPDRRRRHLDRHRPDQLHLPVAALRHERRQLLGYRRRDERHLHPRPR